MSIFGNIMSKLGLKKKTEEAPSIISSAQAAPAAEAAPAAPAAAPAPVAIEVVDVVGQLEDKAKARGGKLNWKTSIVDLLTLLELDSSLASRKELAKELGCPEDKIGGDYSQMNIWLHKTVLQKIAENGGNIPADLH